MQLREVWIRFYKSFNVDYELKANPDATKRSWQETRDGWMPHVRVPLEPDITAIVGANESGKTHLLDAIKIALTGDDHMQRDFCRSSSLFSVERDSRMYPEIGATLTPTSDESSVLQEFSIPQRRNGDVLMLRPQPGSVDVIDVDDERVHLTALQIGELEKLLPHPHELRPESASSR